MNLGTLLGDQRDAILNDFVARARREVPGAHDAPRSEIVDDLPELLDELAKALKALTSTRDAVAPDSRPSTPARAHGRQRHGLRFSLTDVVREYGLLRSCLYDAAERSGVHVTLAEHRCVAKAIDAGVVAAVDEYTEHRRREVELQIARQRALLDILPVGVFITDAKGTIEAINPGAIKIWGAPPIVSLERYGEYKGWRGGERIEGSDWATARALSTGKTVFDAEIEIETFDGRRRIIDNHASPIHAPDGALIGAVCVEVDVTDRVEALRAREQALATVAHDLKNPLASVQLHAQRLARMDVSPTVTRHVDGILRGVQRLRTLIDDLQLSARAEAGRLTLSLVRLDANELVRGALELAEPVAEDNGIALHFTPGPPDVFVDCDPDAMHRVFENLLGNALKFTRRDGSITVVVRATETEVAVSVTDDGIGMTPAQVAHVFERFWQAPAAVSRGTGLGLAIAKAIVEAHRGRIACESAPGEGTSFVVTLPRAR